MKIAKLALIILGSTVLTSCGGGGGGGGGPVAFDHLDTTFGPSTDGVVLTDIRIGAGSDDYANSIAIQSNDKIVAAGISGNGSNNDFALTRYMPDGSLDNSFDGDGVVTTDIRKDVITNIGGDEDIAKSVAIQADGMIVVAGYSSNGGDNDYVLVRYNADGSLDTSFDTDGIVITDIAGDDYATSVAIQTDGKIVVAGYSFSGSDNDYVLVRYNTDGSLDTSFDTDGIVITDLAGDDYATSVSIQPNDMIVVVGYSFNGADTKFALARYDTAGILDNNFGSSGVVTTDIGAGDDYAYSAIIQTDNKIVVAGSSHNGTKNNFALVRYNTNGSPDPSFGANGMVTTAIGESDDSAYSIAVQTNGKIVAAGRTYKSNNFDFALVRCNADGSLDTSFGAGGKVTTAISMGTNEEAYAIAIQADGNIVAAGYSPNSLLDDDFALVRYVP